MPMTRALGILLAVSWVIAPRVALADEAVRGLAGPEAHKRPAKLVVIPGLRKAGDEQSSALVVPKGMLRPGQGPFPNVPPHEVEGTAPSALKLKR
jgi:hypothetical protein